MMNKDKCTGQQVYWNIFDELIDLLDAENKPEIASDMKAAKNCVNGLTDGWFEFKLALEKALKTYHKKMSEEEIYITEYLITNLEKSLIRVKNMDSL
ncbi:hypothetical protein [Parabacteroides sp. FAFU027]|uniref:hypothetical protein n=1 Tax=Parabacteroides sp. FAFU027 TaxID=2922715 RepID=UPI001FAEA00A|nr:hypothetical protein [Parabacteroides sp. FAFU027]